MLKPPIVQAIALAVHAQRSGHSGEAERLLRRALAMDTTAAEGWRRLGGIALMDGRARMAARCFARLMLLEPGRETALHNLGEALRAAGRRGQAATAFRRALALRPDYAKAFAALAMLRLDAGDARGARRGLVRALALDPAMAAGWHGLGLLLNGRNVPDAANRMLRRAVRCNPADAGVRAAYGLGLCEANDHAAGLASLRRAAAMDPGDPGLLGTCAGAAMQAGDFDAALELTRRIRRIDPTAAEADSHDCVLWMLRGDFERSAALGRRALALAPDRAGIALNAALAFHSLRRLDTAIAWDRRALRLDPKSPEARFNLSLALLAKGDFARGWPLYEARWSMSGHGFPRYAPPWDGGPLAGRSVLLVAEQGHGDTLHFVRYAPLLAERGARVVLCVQPLLKRLLANVPGVAAVYGLDETPERCDVCAPLLSLPGLVGTRPDSIPASPYLHPLDGDRRTWRERLAGERRLKVGLVWAGEPRRDNFKAASVDRRRSLALDAFAPFAAVPDVAFYSLQKGEAGAQAKAPPPGMAIADWTVELSDFADTAALVEQLDLVITVDTSVCHLAGGMGRPVWVLSRFDGCWRWLDHREDSPWYPTMRLFHQSAPGDWDGAVARATAALTALAAARAEADQPVPALLDRAVRAHRAGRLEDAAAGYRRVLRHEPAHSDALHLLGLVALARGCLDGAGALLDRAVRTDPLGAAYLNSLGELERRRDRPAAAIERYRRAFRVRPDYAEPLVNLAKLAAGAGQWDDARILLGRATRLAPHLGDAWRVAGRLAMDRGHVADADAAGRRAAALDPADAEAMGLLAEACTLRGRPDGAGRLRARAFRLGSVDSATIWRIQGDALAKAGNHAVAERCLRRAVALHPAFPEALNNLGASLLARRLFDPARIAYSRAIALNPGYPDPWNNRGNALHEIGETAAALSHYRRAVALNPAHPVAYTNLAEALRARAEGGGDYCTAETLLRRALALDPDHMAAHNVQGVLALDLRRLEEAEACFRRILAANPDSAEGLFNLSLTLLKAGRLREAWEPYEARWRVGEIPVPRAPGAMWNGEPLEGRTILLHAEQGNGDVLHFVRYASLVAARGGRVRLAVHRGLTRLMARIPGLLSVHNLNDPVPVTDLHCPLMSLPRAFRTGLDDIPSAMPYLTAEPDEVERWRARLPDDGRLKVGLVWSGDPRPHSPKANAVDRRRSVTLAALAPLAGVQGIAFISLQKGSPAAEARTPPPGLDLIDLMDEVGDFADTAALVSCLDLVITVDTSVAHLAGALGRPVWVLSRFGGCWRWFDHREDSPWYPTMRLFHQPEPGAWAPVVEQVRDRLAVLRAAG